MNLFPMHGASMTSGRYCGGAARRGGRALFWSQKQDLSTASSRPNRSAVGTVPPCPPYRVASYASAMLGTLELDRYGQSCGVSAENERLAARFFLASETTLARAACPFQWRPRTRRRCLTPHPTMNPAAYPDGRWSTGSHTTSGASPVTQRCGFPSVAPSSSLLHRRPRGSTVSMPARFFVGNGNAPREEVAPPSHVDLTAPPIPPTSQENIRRQAQRVRRHTHGAQPRSTPHHQSRSSHIPPFPAPQNFSPQTQTTHPTPPRSSHEQTLALTLTSALVTAWSLRAHSVAVFLGNACVHVNLLLLAETAMRSFAKPSVAYANRIDADRHPRDAPAFLVLDTVALALVVTQPAGVRVRAFRGPQGGRRVGRGVAASIANWTSRAMETTAFDALSRAVAAKEVAAMRLATQVRRLGGARCLPPDANAFARFWRWCACMWDSAKLMAESGSGWTFRRAMLACSLADWGLLLGAWTALGIQGAATHGTWVRPTPRWSLWPRSCASTPRGSGASSRIRGCCEG